MNLPPRSTPLLCGLLLVAGPVLAQQTARPDLKQLKARVLADSNEPEVHYALALGFIRDKKWDDADRQLGVTLSIAPGYAEAWLARSGLFFARGRKYWEKQFKAGGFDSVRARLRQALRDERHAFLLDPLVDLAATGMSDIGETPYLSVENGESLSGYLPWWIPPLNNSIIEMRQGLYPDAMKRLQQVIEDSRIGSLTAAPDLILWYHGLACAHAGEFEDAILDLAMIRVRNDKHIVRGRGPRLAFPYNDLTYMMATAAFHGGQMTDAITEFNQVIQVDFSLYMAHTQLARIYSATGDWPHAVAEREAAVAANAGDPTLLVDLGGTLLKAGRPAEAEEPLTEAITLNPRDALAPYLLGQALDKLGRAEDAKAAYQHFLAIAPSSYSAQTGQVRARLAQ